ncbi:hypothetical protein AB0M25_39450 [Streptomyces griseomycini]
MLPADIIFDPGPPTHHRWAIEECFPAAKNECGGDGRGWARWQRLCACHGRWLLDVGDGHPLEGLAVGPLAGELGRAQRRWAYLARTGLNTGGAGGAPRDVFALARAVAWGSGCGARAVGG